MSRLPPRRAAVLLQQVAQIVRSGASLEQFLPTLERTRDQQGLRALAALRAILVQGREEQVSPAELDEVLGMGSAALLEAALRQGRLADGLSLLARLEQQRDDLRRAILRPLLPAPIVLLLLAGLPGPFHAIAEGILLCSLGCMLLLLWLRRSTGRMAATLYCGLESLAWSLTPSLTQNPSRARLFWLLSAAIEAGAPTEDLLESASRALPSRLARQRVGVTQEKVRAGRGLVTALEESGWLESWERQRLELAQDTATLHRQLHLLAQEDLADCRRAGRGLAIVLAIIPNAAVLLALALTLVVMLNAG